MSPKYPFFFAWFARRTPLVGLLGLAACSITHPRQPKATAREGEELSRAAAALTSAASSHQIAQVAAAGPPTLKTPPAALTAAFIRQFGDGTVVDKILVRQAPAPAHEAPTYYLIGLGLRDGNFRAMALPLNAVGGALYLAPSAERYLLIGAGCSACYFSFEDSHIVGSSCGSDAGSGGCTFRVLNDNTLFAQR